MTAAYGLFDDANSAQLAVRELRAAGVPPRAITVISSEPFEHYDFSRGDRPTWMYWLAGAGAVVGLLFAVWLTRMTQLSWPLPTGGMPIVAMWPNLVIIFELTMLGAVLTTVITLLITAQIPRRRPRLYDPAVSDGRILVGVLEPVLDREALERALTVRGGQFKTIT
jgi:hypothetical protein